MRNHGIFELPIWKVNAVTHSICHLQARFWLVFLEYHTIKLNGGTITSIIWIPISGILFEFHRVILVFWRKKNFWLNGFLKYPFDFNRTFFFFRESSWFAQTIYSIPEHQVLIKKKSYSRINSTPAYILCHSNTNKIEFVMLIGTFVADLDQVYKRASMLSHYHTVNNLGNHSDLSTKTIYDSHFPYELNILIFIEAIFRIRSRSILAVCYS